MHIRDLASDHELEKAVARRGEGRGAAAGDEEMKGCHGIGLVGVLLRQSRQLIAQHLKHHSRIHFRIVDMARLQAPVMVVLDQVVTGIARKCERIEP